MLKLSVTICTAVVAMLTSSSILAQKTKDATPEIAVEKLLTIHTKGDAAKKRSDLIRVLWGKPGLPTKRMPAEINKSFKDNRYEALYQKSLARIDHLVVKMDYDLESHIYHFIPKNANGKLVLYHQGHRGDFIHGKDTIAGLLDAGYAVAGFCMPLTGLNNKPNVLLPRFGYRKQLKKHDDMQYLIPNNGHPVRYFLEPITVFLNYAEKHHKYKSVAMTGISGGGWTTTLCAAVEPRIKYSVPVAGTYPMYLRNRNRRDWGDYEQVAPDVYHACNYLEMYVLGAHGAGRKQLQLINEFDSCCFAGARWKTYHSTVRERVQKLGPGEWDLFMDSSHRGHMISPVALRRILAFLRDM